MEGRLWRTLDRAQEQLISRQPSNATCPKTELQNASDGGRRVSPHRDVNGTDLLLDAATVGVVDLAWQPEIAYHDLA